MPSINPQTQPPAHLPARAPLHRIQQRLASLPGSVRHVIMLAAVPVLYPKIPVAEAAIQFMQGGWL